MGESDGVKVHDVERQGSVTASTTASASDHPDAPLAQNDGSQLEELEEADPSPPTPRFIQDEGTWKHWKWVPYPVRRFIRATLRWTVGPPSAQDFKIKPFFPAIQHAPIWALDKFLPRPLHRAILLFVYLSLWLITFALVMRRGKSVTELEGWGTPIDIGCGSSYWSAGNGCGIDGNDCRPFNGSGFAFRCPGNCLSYQVLNYRAVGNQEIIYQPLVIGGPPADGDLSKAFYRADSFLCGSALHSGLISNDNGGCGVVNLVGTQRNYASTTRNGITSVGFDSYFPRSFAFEQGVECKSSDMRWPLLAVSVVFTTVLSLFTTSAWVFFFANFTIIYWTVGMATDAPSYSQVADLFSNELSNFLPAMFTAWVMYDKMGIRRTLKGLTAQVEKTVLWLGACWVGALTNYTFDFIPIQRLTAHDLQQQPGAIAALTIIVLVLVVVAVSQIWFFRQEGRLVKYLKLYALFIGGIIVCLVLPDLSLRIHHYILALLLLPGTSMQTRPSLLYQGLLIGFFVNGIARWGWDSFLQTSYALQGDAASGSLLPTILDPVISLGQNLSTITFAWASPPSTEYDGISILVNDVERFRTYFSDEINPSTNFTWEREGSLQLNEYFRFAWMEGSSSDDYTMAGTWTAEGEWIKMEPGPSKVKSRSLPGEELVSPVKR
ncbi:LCCL domain-containing protein [Thozetella sp. PMI_491]|nr:LCCL domain-containing protein [Thozetella sp. PMI_491]